jgi:hypothetical protein
MWSFSKLPKFENKQSRLLSKTIDSFIQNATNIELNLFSKEKFSIQTGLNTIDCHEHEFDYFVKDNLKRDDAWAGRFLCMVTPYFKFRGDTNDIRILDYNNNPTNFEERFWEGPFTIFKANLSFIYVGMHSDYFCIATSDSAFSAIFDAKMSDLVSYCLSGGDT